MENYLAIKKNEVLIHATMWMNLKNIMQTEWSKTLKDKYYISIYMKYSE